MLNTSGPLAEHSSGSLVGEKSFLYDSGDGFGDEGAAGEMIGMWFGSIKIGQLFLSNYYNVLVDLLDQTKIADMLLCHIKQHIFYTSFQSLWYI